MVFKKKKDLSSETYHDIVHKKVRFFLKLGKRFYKPAFRTWVQRFTRKYEELLRSQLTPFGYTLNDVQYIIAGIFFVSFFLYVLAVIGTIIILSIIEQLPIWLALLVLIAGPQFLMDRFVKGITSTVDKIKAEQEEDAYDLANSIIAYSYLEDPVKVLEFAASDLMGTNRTASYILSELRKSVHVARMIALLNIEKSVVSPSMKHLMEILIRSAQTGHLDVDGIKEIRDSLAREKQRVVLDRIKRTGDTAYMISLMMVIMIVMLASLFSVAGLIGGGGMDPTSTVLVLVLMAFMYPLIAYFMIGKSFEEIQKKF